MKRPHLIVALALALALPTVMFGAGPSEEQFRRYPVHNLDPSDAISLIYLRLPWISGACRMSPDPAKEPSTAGLRGTILASCGPDRAREGWQDKIAAALAEIDVPPPTYQFHVVVLWAYKKDGPTPELPPSEAKALADFKKVMTYHSFALDAETVVRTDRGAQVDLSGNYVLRLVLDSRSSGSEAIHVKSFELTSTHPRNPPGRGVVYPTYVETSFDLKRGETIVLGSSISGGGARVVLVTALP